MENYYNNIKKDFNKETYFNTEYKNTLVIGDMHFGVKQNSIFWLNKQIEFLQKQVISLIKHSEELNIDSVVFLGDLFDCRQSLNVVIANGILDIITELVDTANKYQCNVYFLGGNHDYYSSFIDKAYINNYNLLFNKSYIEKHKNLHVITEGTSKIYKSTDEYVLILPWFETEVPENFIKNLNESSNDKNCLGIYAHTDLFLIINGDVVKTINKYSHPIWSGHVHYPIIDHHRKLYNLGAACAFNFNDVNQERFIYIINEKYNKSLAILNETTPKFQSFNYNKDKIDFSKLDINNYYTFYCDPKEHSLLKQQVAKSELKNVRIQLLFNDINLNNDNVVNSSFNINDFINNNIPKELKRTFDEIIKDSSQNIP